MANLYLFLVLKLCQSLTKANLIFCDNTWPENKSRKNKTRKLFQNVTNQIPNYNCRLCLVIIIILSITVIITDSSILS